MAACEGKRRRRTNQKRRLLLEAAGGDPLFDEVYLLMPFEGSNNDTTTSDSSSYNHTISREGTGSIISDADQYFGDTATYVDDGTSASGWTAGPDDLFTVYDNEPWTVEFFYKTTAAQTANSAFFHSGGITVGIDNFRRLTINIFINGNQNLTNLTQLYGVDNDVWYHVALVRDTVDEEAYLYINGVSSLTGGGASEFPTVIPNTALCGNAAVNTCSVGYNTTVGLSATYIDSVRWTHGTCRYPSGTTFDIPEEDFPTS